MDTQPTENEVNTEELDLLGIDLSGLTIPSSRGARAKPLTHLYVRDLNEADISLLISNPVRGSETPSIQKLRHSHHTLARLIAEGRSYTEAGLIAGYVISRVSLLMKDPAFQELVEYYTFQVKDIFLNVHERLATMGMDALMELQDRMNDPEAKPFTNKELMDIAELSFDRSGYGPKTTQVHEHKFAMDDLLKAVKDEVRTRQNGNIKTLDARPAQARSSGAELPPDSIPLGLPPGQHTSEPGSGSQGRGPAVSEPRREETLSAEDLGLDLSGFGLGK